MIEAMRGYDAWVTREPAWMDEEPHVLRCSGCGRFLRQTPDDTRSWVQVERCSGDPSIIECTYGESAGDEQILAIIGDEHRGKSYRIAFAPPCGGRTAGHVFDGADSGEIREKDAASYKHEPHFFVPEPWGYQEVALRTCVCGKVNEEPLT